MIVSQLCDILKFRLGGVPTRILLFSDHYTSLLSVDKLIFRKKLPSGKYSYFILNSKVLDSIRSHNFPPSHKNVIAYNYLISRMYAGSNVPLPEILDGFTLAGLDLSFDVNVQDLSPKFGFSFNFFQRLLVGAYSSASKRIIMSLDAFTRYLLRNNASAKSSQTAFYELYSVKENKFSTQAEVSAGTLLLEIQKRGPSFGVPSDFFFGKERLNRSRVSSSFFSFDLDVYDKGCKEFDVDPYKGVTRFELRFRGCDRGALKPDFLFGEGSVEERRLLIEQSFRAFLDRSVLLRQRPSKRISKTSFSNLYRWPEDNWWSNIKSRIFDNNVFHLDEPLP